MTKEVYIKVTKDGPYLVCGALNISNKEIITDEDGFSIDYGEGKRFEIKTCTTALCRCGKSKNAPFCDASHTAEHFDGSETASFEPALNDALKIKGPNLTLLDNKKLCAYARFCDAKGEIWNLIKAGNGDADACAIREAKLCPSGRLVILDKSGNVIEENRPKSIEILEDSGLKISGPIWLRGGIRVESVDGKSYEIRSRQTLCRCGESRNKPFCDSMHARIMFKADYPNPIDKL